MQVDVISKIKEVGKMGVPAAFCYIDSRITQSEKLLQRLAQDKCQPTWQPIWSVHLSTKIAWTTQGVECMNFEVNGHSHSKRHAILLVGRVARLLDRRYSFHKPKAGARNIFKVLGQVHWKRSLQLLISHVALTWPVGWRYEETTLPQEPHSPSHFSHQYHQHLPGQEPQLSFTLLSPIPCTNTSWTRTTTLLHSSGQTVEESLLPSALCK